MWFSCHCRLPINRGIQCDICIGWFHPKCQGVSKYALNAVERHISTLAWLCYDCKQSSLQKSVRRRMKALPPSCQLISQSKLEAKVDTLSEFVQASLEALQQSTNRIQVTRKRKKEHLWVNIHDPSGRQLYSVD